MCGICGYVSRKNITIEELKKMNDTIYHRGPDDSGEEIYPLSGGRSVGLAQRRLSIQDLSPLGHQPMQCDEECRYPLQRMKLRLPNHCSKAL